MNSKAIILAAVVTLVAVLSASVLVPSESDAEFSRTDSCTNRSRNTPWR